MIIQRRRLLDYSIIIITIHGDQSAVDSFHQIASGYVLVSFYLLNYWYRFFVCQGRGLAACHLGLVARIRTILVCIDIEGVLLAIVHGGTGVALWKSMLLAEVILTPLACSNHCDYAAFAPIQQTDSHALLLALLLLLLWSYRSWFGWFSLCCVRFGFHSSAQTQY